MHTIHLMEFTAYDQQDIHDYLLTINETDFRIIMEKYAVAPVDDNGDIVSEYYDAIYYGQKLSELSPNFCYYVPSEFSASPFVYEISTTNMEQLAATMFYLIRGILINEETADILDIYQQEKALFWTQYCDSKIEAACGGLIYIMEKLNPAP